MSVDVDRALGIVQDVELVVRRVTRGMEADVEAVRAFHLSCALACALVDGEAGVRGYLRDVAARADADAAINARIQSNRSAA